MKMVIILISLFTARLLSIYRRNSSILIFCSIERVLSILLMTLLIAGCSSSRYRAYFNNPPGHNYPEYNTNTSPEILLPETHPIVLDKNEITASTIIQPTLIEDQITSLGPKFNEETSEKIISRKTIKQNVKIASSGIIKNKKSNEIESNQDKPRKGWHLALSIILFILGIVFAIGGAWSVLLIVFSVLAFVGSVFYFIRWLRNANLENKDGKISFGKILLILAGITLLLGLTSILFDF